MSSDVRFDRRLKAAAEGVFGGLRAAPIALLMAPGIAAAQENPTKLPEIHVIATTPVAPPPRVSTRAAGATSAPATRAPATRAPATSGAAAAVPETTAKPVPGRSRQTS